MAYSGFGYGNYPYFQQNQQQDNSSNGSNNQRYQGQQNPYSPYYQSGNASYGQQPSNDQQTSQAHRQSQPYQSKPAESSPYANAYYQQQQQQQQPQYSQRTTTTSEGDSNAYSQPRQYASNTSTAMPTTSAASTNGSYQYGQTVASYGDTSGLGSLAYASSLGRASPATTSARYTQPANNPPSYSSASPVYQTQQPQQAAYGRDSSSTQERVNQSSPYMSQQQKPAQSPQPIHGVSTSATSQYRAPNSAHSRVGSAASQQQRYPSPLQGPVARPPATQGNLSPQMRNPSATQGANSRPQSARNPPTRTPNAPPPQQQQQPAPSYSRQPENRKSEKIQSPSMLKAQYANAGSASQPRNDVPTTVDPSQVFDQAEFQRRKAAQEAEAAAARRAAQEAQAAVVRRAAQEAEAERARLATENAEAEAKQQADADAEAKAEAARKRVEAKPAKPAKQASEAPGQSQTRDQIQAEMKAMIERMREYKSQDPAAFTEIWEQFKKMQNGPARTPSQTAQTMKAAISKASNSSVEQPSASPQIGSHSPALPSGVEQGGGEGLQDRGKFPAMRRRTRTDKGKARPRDIKLEGHSTPTAPLTTQTPASANPQQHDPIGADTMRQAMARFHNTPTPSSSSQSSPPPAMPVHAAYSPRGAGKPLSKGTIWPEKDKGRLAATAKRCLESYAPNKGRTIATSLIHSFLDRNPSYDELCQLLMAEGFRFDRSEFARTLLAVVPTDAPQATGPISSAGPLPPKPQRGRPRKDGSQQSTPSKNSSPAQAPGIQFQPYKKPLVFKEPYTKGSPPMQAPGRSGSITSQPGTPVAPEYQGYYSRMQLMSGALSAGGSSNSQAASKQEQARKRNFDDLVDMTQVSDDDNAQKKRKERVDRSLEAQKAVAGAKNVANSATAATEKVTPGNLNEHGNYSGNHGGIFDQFLSSAGSRSQNDHLRTETVVQSIDFAKVARRNSYNPLTIARDVLISKGAHPSERPLNEHLIGLRLTFKSVTDKADLSTFRWDLVDPGEEDILENVLDSIEKDPGLEDSGPAIGASPPASQAKPAFREFQSILTRGGGSVRGRAVSQRSIRDRNSLVSSSHGNPRPALENGTHPLQNSFRVAPKPNMDTDVTETQDEMEMSGAETAMPSMLAASANLLSPAKNPRVSALAHHGPMKTPDRGLTGGGTPTGSSGSGGKRRGRPPGSMNKKTREMREAALAAGTLVQPEKKRGRPPGSGRGRGRPAKPRPDAINKTVPADGIGVMLQQKSPADVPFSYSEARPPPVKERRNWKKDHIYHDNEHDDSYVSYDCKWADCHNQGLHNLETLRKHVEKIHIPRAQTSESGSLRCSWGDCQAGDNQAGFPDTEALLDHIEKRHFQGLARQFGDGPFAQPSDVDPMAYLSDSTGRQVTPIARTEGPKDPLPLDLPAERLKELKKEYHLAHGNRTPLQKMRAIDESNRQHQLADPSFTPVNRPEEEAPEEESEKEDEEGEEEGEEGGREEAGVEEEDAVDGGEDDESDDGSDEQDFGGAAYDPGEEGGGKSVKGVYDEADDDDDDVEMLD